MKKTKYRYKSRQQQIKVYAKGTLMLGFMCLLMYGLVELVKFFLQLL